MLVGGRLTFTNNDLRLHDMASDPVHVHTDCPSITEVGFLLPGQSLTTSALTEPRICGYHDHLNENDERFHGTVVIEAMTVQ